MYRRSCNHMRANLCSTLFRCGSIKCSEEAAGILSLKTSYAGLGSSILPIKVKISAASL